MIVALPEESLDLLNGGTTKVAPIDGVVNLGAVESGKDGVGFGHQRATVVKFGFGHSPPLSSRRGKAARPLRVCVTAWEVGPMRGPLVKGGLWDGRAQRNDSAPSWPSSAPTLHELEPPLGQLTL
jgi:hypothetical protein